MSVKSYEAPPSHTSSVYVGDLNSEVSEGLLFEIFKRVGAVSSIRVCRDSVTKKSLGYAYVNFVNFEDARRAIDTLNNTSIKGRACRIMWCNRDPSTRRSGVGNIFIRGLDPTIGPKELHDTFSQFGNIISCKVATYPDGKSKGYGYVHFENHSNAEQAIKIVNNKQMGENIVHVSPFIPRHERLKRIEQTWTNVYVKNLPVNYTDQNLRDLFGRFGEITSCIVRKKEPIPSLFGFCNFKNHPDAEEAVKVMNGYQLDDNILVCCRAQKKAERQAELRRNYDIKRRDTITKYQGRNLFVKHIEDHITEEKFRKEFEPFGKIVSLRLMLNEKGVSKGFGFVCYETQEEAKKALEGIGKNTVLPESTKPLYVAIHEPKEIRQQKFSRTRKPQQPNMYPPQGPQGTVYYNPQPYNQQMMRTQQFQQQVYQQQFVNIPQQQHQARGRGRPPQGGQVGGGRPQGKQDDQVKLQLGEELFSKISEKNQPLAGKITGMIIHSPDFSFEAVNELLHDESKLDHIINEAKSFLEQQMKQQTDDDN